MCHHDGDKGGALARAPDPGGGRFSRFRAYWACQGVDRCYGRGDSRLWSPPQALLGHGDNVPVPAHTRITFSGTFGPEAAPVEIWSFNINHAQILDPPGDLAAAATQMRAAWVAQIAALQHNTVKLTRVRVAQVNALGKVPINSQGAYLQGDSLGINAGELTGSGFFPLQTALCVSLETTRAGASGKGRFYLPAPPYPLNEATFGFVAANVTTVSTRARAFINLINSTLTPAAGGVVVASSKGFVSDVVAVRVGSIPDTQRRRRNALPEAYVRTALAP